MQAELEKKYQEAIRWMQKEIDYLRYELDVSRKSKKSGEGVDQHALQAEVAVLRVENKALLERLENKGDAKAALAQQVSSDPTCVYTC